MCNIMERMTEMETEMTAKDYRIAVLEDAMETKDQKIAVLEGAVETLKSAPFAFQCAWQDGPWVDENSVITFDRLTYDGISGGNGGLDINTGIFTVDQGFSGVWSITYSIKSVEYNGEHNQAWLFINGERIAESYHNTEYYDGCCGQFEGHIQSLGSRTLYMRLEAGDTVSLRSGTVGHGLYQITLCFHLAQVDS